jgi:hypothetical protein
MNPGARKAVFFSGAAALALYSIFLVYLEATVSQEYVRRFVDDITGPSRFYAINTTLCVFLEWSCALLFAICLTGFGGGERWPGENLFYYSQIAVFAYLGFDDRFRIHEMLGGTFGFNDAFIILGLGLIEALLLLTWGRILTRSRRLKGLFIAAGVCFVVMVVIDGLAPRELIPRLTLEKLTKSWGCFFLFLFAWEWLMERIGDLREARLGGQE